MYTGSEIRSIFPSAVSELTDKGAIIYYYPVHKRFKIITKDKKTILRTFDEMTELEQSLNNKSENILQRIFRNKNRNDSIDII